MRRFFLLVLFAFFATCSLVAQAEDAPGVYIIYDSSNSMWGELPDGSRKYEAARLAMEELVQQDFDSSDVALRMYGHRRKDDCSDSELVLGFGDPARNRNEIIGAMTAVRPTGRTPIDLSLRQALEDFGNRSGSIILISDGIESCNADPCALVRAWRGARHQDRRACRRTWPFWQGTRRNAVHIGRSGHTLSRRIFDL